ncbi:MULTISPECIES: hypothetical protein [Leptolyngbya]|uniref:hypothetical protein n=1 Tax=Leptolyngbya TaxID=47251 RepID=UPI001683E0E8|nr:hypothetical protein [Leptolyngbya sp. FACHB-1624]MBD1858521.1 hypothetical protein [Leptolyngbya sp. FACHB-1624]
MTLVFFAEALAAARLIKNKVQRASALCNLAKLDSSCFEEALTAVRLIDDEGERASALCNLAKLDSSCFEEALTAVQLIDDPCTQYGIFLFHSPSLLCDFLCDLAQIGSVSSSHLLSAAQLIEDKVERASALCSLAKFDPSHLQEALSAARLIEDKVERASALCSLAKFDPSHLQEALSAARLIENRSKRALMICDLAKLDSSYLEEALAVTRSIDDKHLCLKYIVRVAAIFQIYQSEHDVYGAFQRLKNVLGNNEAFWAVFLCDLACIDVTYIEDAVDFIQTIQSRFDCALLLNQLACKYSQLIPVAFQSACTIQDKSQRNLALKDLINNSSSALIPEFFKLASEIENSQLREEILFRIVHRKVLPKRMNTISLSEELQNLNLITKKVDQAQELAELLPRLPLDILPVKRWTFCLRLLAHRSRAQLMQDFGKLYPAIVHLGGKEAVRGMVDAMREVCQQWK